MAAEEEIGEQGTGLKGSILSQIEERGPIPFSHYMDWCLYHPDYGYYQSERKKTGKEGDYFTGPCVHPLFGQLIGRQLSQMAEILGEERFDIVEIGGGRGFLCQDILDWAKEKAFPFYQRLKYHLMETGPASVKEQRERLFQHEKGGRVVWTDSRELGQQALRFRGCVLSNELIDAFPVHRVVFDRGQLKEIYVTQKEGHLQEEWNEPSDPALLDYFQSMGIRLLEGQKAEVNLKARDWIRSVSQSLERGFVLTIDYGDRAGELYAPHRYQGTLLCYRHHRTSEDFYEYPGEQDITSHVNFTSLILWGEETGLQLTGLVPQYRFLIGLGLLQEMESMERTLSDMEALQMRLSLKHLIEPETGMGEIFKVLIQHKGILKPRLDGLRELDAIPVPT